MAKSRAGDGVWANAPAGAELCLRDIKNLLKLNKSFQV